MHPEYWHKEDHYRFEDRVSGEILALREDVEKLTHRLTLMLGAIAVLAFSIPLLAPIIQNWLSIPPPQ